MSRLLVVEDDSSLGATLQERLQREGFDVAWTQSLSEARLALSSQRPEVIVLDVSLPDGSGFDLAREVRGQIPFLMMTALSSAENRLAGFELGAEEFVPKPFHFRELLLRLRHVLEHHKPHQEIRSGGFALVPESLQLVLPSGERRHLSVKDFSVLRMLVEASPRVVSRDAILNRIWGEDQFPSPRTVDNSIVRIRSEVGDPAGERIRTVRGVGYQWLAEGAQE